MPRRFRPRLSYANVTATLALVLALGGASYAAVKINGRDIKARSIPAAKIKKNTLTGSEIKESKLGKVPLAALADSATQAGTATNAADAAKLGGEAPAAFKLACPQGTTLKLGECFETTLRATATLSSAAATCGAAGRRVPTFTELEAVRQNGLTVGVEPNEYELTATFVRDGAADAVVGIDPMGNRLTMPYGTFSKPYRCVALPTNTG